MELSGRLVGAAAMIEVGAADPATVPDLMRRISAEIEAIVKGEPR